MKKLHIKYFLIIILSISSCTKDLKLEPVSQISNATFWKTENDAKAGLYGMYVRLRIPASSSFFAWGEGRSEIMGPSYLGAVAGFDAYYRNSLDKTNVAATYNGGNTTWSDLYAVIHDANLILKNVPNIKFTSEDTKNDILAQAHTMRAFIYFLMVKTWGDVPLVTEPIESVDAESIQKERTPKEEIFKFIKKEIDIAVTLFPSNKFTAGRRVWSKSAVNALKADIYLWTGKRLNGGNTDFTVALDALNEAQKGDLALLGNFADVFAYNNKGNKEIIMAVNFTELEVTASTARNGTRFMYSHLLPSNINKSTKDSIGALSVNGGYWAPTFEVCSQFTTDDQRRNTSFIQIYTFDPQGKYSYYASLVYKFRGIVVGGNRVFLDDVVIYRYADILLMKAEAKNALGQDPSIEINEVRRRAYGNNFSSHVFVNGTKEGNDEAILQERLFELIFEGKRWWDLIRFGKVFTKVPSLQSRAGQDYLLLFPISEVTLSLEPKVKQNPGY